jgi:hypothetical protein
MAPFSCVSTASNERENSMSHPLQTSEHGVFPPFSGQLREDEQLKLSHVDLKQTIDFTFNGKDLKSLSQLTATPAFPTPHVLAQFASKTYKDYEPGETDADYEKR